MKLIHKFYHMMLSEKRNLEEKIESVREQIRSLPAGNLICTRNGNHFKWYQSEGSKASSSYIPKSNRLLAEQLAAKKYLSLQEKELLQELKAVNSYLNCHSLNGDETAETLSEHSEYAELLFSYFKPLSKELSDWALASYERSNSYQEQLIHRTVSGIYVRSKSEAVIAALLHMYKIPFRYECALQLGEIVVYPDFTIRHPKNGKIFYWEPNILG